MASQYLQVRLEADLKSEAESVLNQMGLTMTQAVKLFFKQVIMRKAIPFSVVIPNKKREYVTESEEAMIEESLNNISKGKGIAIDMSNTKQVKKYFGV